MAKVDILTRNARIFYDTGDPSHDFAHIQRVVAKCRRLGAAVCADLELLIPAAILHDIVNLPKNHPERSRASEMAADQSRQVLVDAGYSQEEIQSILKIVTEHSYSLGRKPSSIESAVLQDADRLDALGAIGVMRTVTCGCRMGATYYDPTEPFAVARALDDKSYTVDHFYKKLFKLPELMNTDAARLEANDRVRFMHTFIEQLAHEIEPTCGE